MASCSALEAAHYLSAKWLHGLYAHDLAGAFQDVEGVRSDAMVCRLVGQ